MDGIARHTDNGGIDSPSKKKTKSPKFLEARERLPEEHRELYDQLVDEYHYRTCLRFGAGYVAYQVLADLILVGWRPSAEAHPDVADVAALPPVDG